MPTQSGTDVETALYVTVGVPLGPFLQQENDTVHAAGLLRRGQDMVIVNINALPLITRATAPASRTVLEDWALGEDIDDPSTVIDALVDEGILFCFGQHDESTDIATLRQLRLQTTGIGQGCAVDDAATFNIVDHEGRSLVQCDALLYELWAASDGRSISELSRLLAPSFNLLPDEVVRHVLHNMEDFLSAGVAFLDLAAP